jgi:hypothetical protein
MLIWMLFSQKCGEKVGGKTGEEFESVKPEVVPHKMTATPQRPAKWTELFPTAFWGISSFHIDLSTETGDTCRTCV